MNSEEQQTITVSAAAAAAVQAKVEAAFTSMGQAVLTLAKQQAEHAETINQMIADRNQQLDLIGQLLQKIEVLVKLQDADHAVIEVLSGMKGMTKPASC